MSNVIRIIAPYRHHGTWVFDDPSVGLDHEPFVAGIPEMIDTLIADVAGVTDHFRLLFSDRPFPGHQWELIHVRKETEGHWYKLVDPEMEGWLCPALFKYFEVHPNHIYVKAEPVASDEDHARVTTDT